MSFATETLALAQAAYQKALSGQTVRFNDRQWTAHNIGELLAQVKYWEAQVAAETGRAAGRPSRAPLRFRL
jgi:hypothetical protein